MYVLKININYDLGDLGKQNVAGFDQEIFKKLWLVFKKTLLSQNVSSMTKVRIFEEITFD